MVSTLVELSIIIVNWNSVVLLRKCLQSIELNSAGLDLELLVIDNASFDGSADLVAKEFPGVTFIQSDENLGFAAGNNLAFERSRGRYVLFLNPDAEIVGDALKTMLAVVKHRPDAGVVGPKLVNPDLSAQIDCMRAFPTILNQLFDSSLTRNCLGVINFAGVKPVVRESVDPIAVEMLPGTCVMMRREVFEEAGRFNDQYFMYAEDIELSYRVKSTGWTNYYVSKAAVIHHGGRSSEKQNESCFSTVMIRESVWQFLCATHGRWYGAVYRITTCSAAIARITVLSLMWVFPASHMIRCRATRSTRKWLKILRWCLGLESWTHGYSLNSRRGRSVLVA